jgi:hypothetical protein
MRRSLKNWCHKAYVGGRRKRKTGNPPMETHLTAQPIFKTEPQPESSFSLIHKPFPASFESSSAAKTEPGPSGASFSTGTLAKTRPLSEKELQSEISPPLSPSKTESLPRRPLLPNIIFQCEPLLENEDASNARKISVNKDMLLEV